MNRFLSVAFAAPVIFLATISAALADGGTITGTDIYNFLMPTIQAVVGALLAYGVGWLFVLVKNKLGISIDDSMRSSIQTAATNAAGLVLNSLGNTLQGKTITVSNPLIADAVNYVLKNAPDGRSLRPDARFYRSEDRGTPAAGRQYHDYRDHAEHVTWKLSLLGWRLRAPACSLEQSRSCFWMLGTHTRRTRLSVMWRQLRHR